MTNAIRLRRDPVLLSSLLFTVALVFRVPELVRDAVDRNPLYQAVGFASLANIAVGLVVVWSGFRNKYRWTWVVMFIIVWIWGFPLFIWPILQGKIVVTFAEWVSEAWHSPGSARIHTENIALFFVMLVALVLPLKSFFGGTYGRVNRDDRGGKAKDTTVYPA